MLQSEFYDRTHVTLTAEQYGEVENVYNRVQMDKDEFCRLWLDNRDNKIIAELLQYAMGREQEIVKLERENDALRKKLDDVWQDNEERMQSFGRKILANLDDESRIYDACEEEFTLDFICKVKLEEDIDLEEHERKHLLQKL